MGAYKVCAECGISLSPAAFNRSARSNDGLARRCRICTNAARRDRARSAQKQLRIPSRYSLLATALRTGDVLALQQLIELGLTPDRSWICEAMRQGHATLAMHVLGQGVVHDVFTMAAVADLNGLSHWLRRNKTDAKLAVSMEPASKQVTPLHVGCASDWLAFGQKRMRDQLQIAVMLTENGADLTAAATYRGIENANALFCACWTSRNLALVRWMLDRGVPAAVIHLTAALGHFQRHRRAAYDIAEVILEFGVPVDGDILGRTTLQAFAHQGDTQTVAWLIDHGAQVNARSAGGRTAIHYAAERNANPKTLAILVDHGADLTGRDADGLTPLDIARRNGKLRLVEWIEGRLRMPR